MRLPRALAPLRHRRYAALWTGAFASNIGTWMESVAVGVLVTTTTGQAGWAGLVAAAAFVPNALLGPLGGALADRVPRRALLLGTTAVQAMLAAGLTALAAFDAAEPWAVTLIVLASGCAGALGFPAYQSMMPDLVPREDLTGAVALGAAQWNLGRVIGPVLAGVVIALGGYEWAFAVNTVSFLAVIVAIAPIRLPAPSPTAGESIATGGELGGESLPDLEVAALVAGQAVDGSAELEAEVLGEAGAGAPAEVALGVDVGEAVA